MFSLEGKDLDKQGAFASVEGLTGTLLKNDRFTTVKNIDVSGIYNTAPGLFPSPLSWDEVEQLCKRNNTDALFALELFDTDSRLSYNANPVSINTSTRQSTCY